jgi:hypothetical protein
MTPTIAARGDSRSGLRQEANRSGGRKNADAAEIAVRLSAGLSVWFVWFLLPVLICQQLILQGIEGFQRFKKEWVQSLMLGASAEVKKEKNCQEVPEDGAS